MPVKKATKTKKPLKILMYGASGVGKTHFALYATPGKTLVFDMEGGTDLFEGRVDFDYWTDDEGFKTQSYRELRKCIDFLKTQKDREYKTFIIDPVTLIWTLLQQERQDYKEDKVTKQKANETDLENFTTRDWNIVKKMHKGIIDEVSALPQNVILIAREKPVVKMVNGEPVPTGDITFEGEKNTIYAVDFALRLYSEKKKRLVQIAKDRSGHYETGAVLETPSFALFDSIVNDMADGTDSKSIKTGSENLFGGKPEPGLKLISNVQKTKIQELAKVLGKTGADITEICKHDYKKQFSQLTEAEAGEIIATLQIELDKLAEPTPASNKAMSEKTNKVIHARGAELGMDHDDIRKFAQCDYPIKSLTELTEDQARELLANLRALPDLDKAVGA